MTNDGIRHLVQAQAHLIERYELARASNRPPEEIAQLEDMLAAVSIMMEAREHGQTFH